MLLKEILTLFEMSISFPEAQNLTHNYVPTIVSHTFKILLYPNAQAVNKWHGEINGYFKRLTNRKLNVGNKRPPSGTQIIAWINEIVTPQYINRVLQQILSEYGTSQITPTNIDNLWQQIQQAYVAIADRRENVTIALSKIRI
ncbi:MAG: hypothetical protein ACREAU_01135 [Nitrosopumilaceae archaeon]